MKFTLVIMALNEREGLKVIMPQINKKWVDQILIVDGGSKDGSVDWARKAGYEVLEQKNKGLRMGYFEALPHIKHDYMITFSPDGNSVVETIPPLIEKIKEGYDMVIVSRYKDDAKSDDDDFITAFGNWMFTSVINLLHGGNYTDAMVMLRGYKKQILYDLGIAEDKPYKFPELIFFTNISIEPILSARAAKRKLKVAEIPGDEPARIGGERKLQIIRWGCAYLYQVIRDAIFWK